jgi:hypothetical protein
MSETLREEKGRHEVGQQDDAQDEPNEVLGAHSRSTALRTSRDTVKKRAVSPR